MDNITTTFGSSSSSSQHQYVFENPRSGSRLKRARQDSPENDGDSTSMIVRSRIPPNYRQAQALAPVHQHLPKLRADKYTIGWLCALHEEYVAASCFLDEEHEGPKTTNPNDTGSYTLGRMGSHNVVIASFKEGSKGISAASVALKDLTQIFPQLRVCMIVGIGGGAPALERNIDIRLGDVVVSTPENGPGVLQHFYNVVQGQTQDFLPPKVPLNKPSPAILKAVRRLRKKITLQGHQITEEIDGILSKNPRLKAQGYKRPDSCSDRLYISSIVHSDRHSSCEQICPKGSSDLISREERSEYEDNPCIHYGTIASGDQLMRNAIMRDQIGRDYDVLCFEMEAAGLMDHFPSIAIRGIGDYSDSHKNDKWKKYAAMTAGAYAKALLCELLPEAVQTEDRFVDMLSEVSNTVYRVEGHVEKLRSEIENTEMALLLDWIATIDYTKEQNRYRRQRLPESGKWLLDSVEFQIWLQGDSQTILCLGIPGAGKTILTSIVIDTIANSLQSYNMIGIVYMYCDFKRQDSQTYEDLLANMLKQLVKSTPTLPKALKNLYQSNKHEGRIPDKEVLTCLELVIALYSKVYIIIDALDECQPRCRAKILSELHILQRKFNINFFATSRDGIDIRERSQDITIKEIRAHAEDIRRYIASRIPDLPAFVNRSLDLVEEIKVKIIAAVDGMFKLAELHVNSLIGKRSPRAIRDAIATLPVGSDESAYDCAYKAVMERIENQSDNQGELAMEVLSWIVCARRPLTRSELQQALAIKIGELELDVEEIPDLEHMISTSAGLVIVDNESDTFQLAHYTIHEYLNRKKDKYFPHVEDDVAAKCVTYLSFTIFEDGLFAEEILEDCGQERLLLVESQLAQHPFLGYAAGYWTSHFIRSSRQSELLVSAMRLCDVRLASFRAWFEVWRVIIRSSDDALLDWPALMVASYFGLDLVVKKLINDGVDIDFRDKYGCTALLMAAENGHYRSVMILLDAGAEVSGYGGNAQLPYYGSSAVFLATENGHRNVVQLLMDRGASAEEWCTDTDETAIHIAARNGHLEILRDLLNRDYPIGIDPVNILCSLHTTPLHSAVDQNSIRCVKALVEEYKANVNAISAMGLTPLHHAIGVKDRDLIKYLAGQPSIDINAQSLPEDVTFEDTMDTDRYGTALHYAVAHTDYSTVRTLLDYSPNLNARDVFGQTSATKAAIHGEEGILQLLLARGAESDPKDKKGWTPLYWAMRNGHYQCAQLLLTANNVDHEHETEYQKILLFAAVKRGDLLAVRELIDKGVNINISDSHAFGPIQTPLSIAIEKGHESIVRQLIDSGADIEAKASSYHENGIAALGVAVLYNQEDIVNLLLIAGAYIETKTDGPGLYAGYTPLRFAAMSGNESIARILLDHQADVNSKDCVAKTPLHAAVVYKHDSFVRLLLDRGADVNAKDIHDETPLRLAIWSMSTSLLSLLLERGASPNVRYRDGYTALLDAVRCNRISLAGMLLHHGADVRIEHFGGQTPLHMAAEKGFTAMVDLLLKNHSRVTTTDANGRSPLALAAYNGHIDVMRLLLKNGADINAGTYDGMTPLMYALRQPNHENTIRFLLSNNANPSFRDKLGQTVLMHTSGHGHTRIARVLLSDQSLELMAKDFVFGATALHWAALEGHVDVAKMLIAREPAIVDQQDEYGHTALSVAAAYGHEKLIKLLVGNTCGHITANDTFGLSPLILSMANRHNDVQATIRQAADSIGFKIKSVEHMHEDPCKVCPKANLVRRTICVICLLYIWDEEGWSYHHCVGCTHSHQRMVKSFEFDICQECYEQGLRCPCGMALLMCDD